MKVEYWSLTAIMGCNGHGSVSKMETSYEAGIQNQNQNQVYCQVSLHLQGICFGVLVQHSKQLVTE